MIGIFAVAVFILGVLHSLRLHAKTDVLFNEITKTDDVQQALIVAGVSRFYAARERRNLFSLAYLAVVLLAVGFWCVEPTLTAALLK